MLVCRHRSFQLSQPVVVSRSKVQLLDHQFTGVLQLVFVGLHFSLIAGKAEVKFDRIRHFVNGVTIRQRHCTVLAPSRQCHWRLRSVERPGHRTNCRCSPRTAPLRNVAGRAIHPPCVRRGQLPSMAVIRTLPVYIGYDSPAPRRNALSPPQVWLLSKGQMGELHVGNDSSLHRFASVVVAAVSMACLRGESGP